MNALNKQIYRARRRLMLQQFIGNLAWCWFVLLLVAAGAIGASKIWDIGIEGSTWSALWISAALGLGAVAAALWTWYRHSSALEAALEIDRRFSLRERVSSTLALNDNELQTDIGQALVKDTAERVARLNIVERFSLKLPRRVLLPLLPAAVALALIFLVEGRVNDNQATAATSTSAPQQIKTSVQALQKKLAERRQEAHDKKLDSADGLLKKLEEGTKDLSEKNESDRKQALVKLNDLAKDLEKRRESLGGDDKLKQKLNQLKDLQNGPADKLGQAIKEGDLGKAVAEIKKLQEQMAKNNIDAKSQQEMAKQLEQMQKTLDKMNEAHKQAMKDLKQQIKQAQDAGQAAKAEKLQQQLNQLQQQKPQMAQLNKMAQQLGQAAKAMQQGQGQKAQEALGKLGDQLAAMQHAQAEMDLLEDALEQIADAKEGMACKSCGGAGCKECQGKRGGNANNKNGKRGRGDGLGMARGARGDRPEEKSKTDTYDSSVKQNVGRGGAVVTGQVGGANRKGQVEEEIKGQFTSARNESEDPLTGQRLPHDYREHAKKYFDAFREGQK